MSCFRYLVWFIKINDPSLSWQSPDAGTVRPSWSSSPWLLLHDKMKALVLYCWLLAPAPVRRGLEGTEGTKLEYCWQNCPRRGTEWSAATVTERWMEPFKPWENFLNQLSADVASSDTFSTSQCRAEKKPSGRGWHEHFYTLIFCIEVRNFNWG